MLPAIERSSKFGVGPTFTRRPDWVSPLESLWSILSKWQFANRVAYSVVAQSFFAGAYVQADLGVDLRLGVSFDLRRISEHTGVPLNDLARGLCALAHHSRLGTLASEHLRFCATCLATGFHATLFQFALLARCPIHLEPLRHECHRCGHPIPYRLTPAFLAHPYGCPRCAQPWLQRPHELGRRSTREANAALLGWQQYIAAYAFWYADGSRQERDATGRFLTLRDTRRPLLRQLRFLPRLQRRLQTPPPLPVLAAQDPARKHRGRKPPPTNADPPYSRIFWPHFHSPLFLTLYQRYHCIARKMERRWSPRNRLVTHWWRSAWEGTALNPPATDLERYPPFGIAEWLGFAPMNLARSGPSAPVRSLATRFEDDLQRTWHAWGELIDSLDPSSLRALRPQMIPARACWIPQPAFEPGTPALGFA
jgi:hypothetical protein